MRRRNLGGPVIARLTEHPARHFADAAAWQAHLDHLGITGLKVNPDPVMVATEAALWGAVAANGFLDGTVTEVPGTQPRCPQGLCDSLLEHEGVDIDHAVLEHMERQHADFVVVSAVAGKFSVSGEEDEVVGTVPLLDDVEAFIDLTAEVLAVQIVAQEYCLDGFAKFCKGFVADVPPLKRASPRATALFSFVFSACRQL